MKWLRATSKIGFVLLFCTLLWLTVSFASHHDLGGTVSSGAPLSNDRSKDDPMDRASDIDRFIQRFKDDMTQSDTLLDDFFDESFFHHFDDPFKEMEEIRKQMEERLDRFHTPLNDQFNRRFDNWFDQRSDAGADARMETREDDDYVYCTIDVGKVNPKDLHVDIKGEALTVSGTVKVVDTSEENGVKRSKAYLTKFYRRFPVPEGVVVDKADVRVETGKIIVKFPKDRN